MHIHSNPICDPIDCNPLDCTLVIWIHTWSIGIAAALFALNGVLSVYLALGLNKKLAVAAVRCVIQLTILGFLLHPVVYHEHWLWTLLFSTGMLLVSSVEVMSRPSYSYAVSIDACALNGLTSSQGMYQHILTGIGGSCSIVLAYAYFLVITWHSDYHWYKPQYLIPLLGMLLGNTISGVSLGLTTVLEELAAGRERVECLLAVGATRFEATRGIVQRSLHMALIPMINQMSVVGIVSIPGMMTGQILSGVVPLQAAGYQIAVLLFIGCSTSLGSVITVLLAIRWIVDGDHRLRQERLNRRNRPAGVEVWAMAHALKVLTSIPSPVMPY